MRSGSSCARCGVDMRGILRGLAVLGALLLLVCVFPDANAISAAQPNPVVVVHWSAGHLMPDRLLPKFAQDFNAAGHTTASGRPIQIRPVLHDSYEQVNLLAAAVQRSPPAGA